MDVVMLCKQHTIFRIELRHIALVVTLTALTHNVDYFIQSNHVRRS